MNSKNELDPMTSSNQNKMDRFSKISEKINISRVKAPWKLNISRFLWPLKAAPEKEMTFSTRILPQKVEKGQGEKDDFAKKRCV